MMSRCLQYTAMYSLSHVLRAAGRPESDALMSVGALTAATTAASSPSMGQHIVLTLLEMKNTSMLDLVMADSGPEAMIMISGVAGPVEDHCDENCSMFIFNQPGLDASEGGADEELGMAQSASPSWTAVQFICGLVQYGPEGRQGATFSGDDLEDEDSDPEYEAGEDVELIPVELQLKEVLQGWAASEHKNRLADGSSAKLLEVVVIEICLGLIAGAVRGKISVSSEDSDEDTEEADVTDIESDDDMAETEVTADNPGDITWILDVLSVGYTAAEMKKGNLWACAFASAARMAANAVVMHEQEDNMEMQVVATEALNQIVNAAHKLTRSWKGTQPYDLRHVSLLSYLIDNILQADVSRKSGNVLEPLGATLMHPEEDQYLSCLLYTSPSPRDRQKSRMPSSA